MSEKLTPKQKKFVKEYVDCGNGAEAARKAGYSEGSAKEIASENLTKPNIRESIREEFGKIGVTVPSLLTKIKEGTNAELVKIATHEGRITDERSYTDHVTRHKWVDMALKLLDLYPSEKLDVTNRDELTPEQEEARWGAIERMIAKKQQQGNE